MMQYWYSLADRERKIIAIGSIAVVAIILWALLWDPMQKRLSTLRTQVPEKEMTLAWMHAQTDNVQNLREQTQVRRQSPDANIPLVTVIEQTAADVSIRNVIRRIEPENDSSVKVWLTDAYFDPWVQWAEVLKQRGVRVSQANIARGNNNTVTVRATFTRG